MQKNFRFRSSPNVGRVAQRKKKFNQFYCLIMILGYKRNSKLLFMKKNLEPSWRYHLTHTANSAQIWQNFMAGYTRHSIWLKISFHFCQFWVPFLSLNHNQAVEIIELFFPLSYPSNIGWYICYLLSRALIGGVTR